jgi:hypothetical protein
METGAKQIPTSFRKIQTAGSKTGKDTADEL